MVAGGDGAFDDRLAPPARHPERTKTELWNRVSMCLEGFRSLPPLLTMFDAMSNIASDNA